jgi:hypothetical protein
VKITVCATKESSGTARKVTDSLRRRGHNAKLILGGMRKCLDALGDADALLVVNDEEDVAVELIVAMVLADYLGKKVLTTKPPRNEAMRSILASLDLEVID